MHSLLVMNWKGKISTTYIRELFLEYSLCGLLLSFVLSVILVLFGGMCTDSFVFLFCCNG